jgi:hypothetical protein
MVFNKVKDMPRRWNDSQNMMGNKRLRLLILILASPGFLFLPLDLLFAGRGTVNDYVDFFGAGFIWWMIKFNGSYKMARFLAEWYLKRKDNKFHYYSSGKK